MMRVLLLLLSLNMAFAQQAETEEEARLRILREYGDPDRDSKLTNEYMAKALERTGKQLESLREQFYTPEMIATQSQGVLLITDEEKSYLGPQKSKILIEARKKQREVFLTNLTSKKEIKVIESDITDAEIPPVTIEDDPMELGEEKKKINNLLENSGDLKESIFTKFMGQNMKGELQQLMQSNPMAKMSKSQVEDKLSNILKKDSTLSKALKESPKLKEFIVEFVRDKKAIKGIVSIINKPEVLKKYGMGALVIFVIAFILNLLNAKASLFKRILIKLGITFGSLALNIAIFYYLFRPELSPTIDVFKRVF